MNILITGSEGFMGKNLQTVLRENAENKLYLIDTDASAEELADAAANADFVFHLAGVNRPKSSDEFISGNADFTQALMTMLEAAKRPPVVLSSSTQAALDNPYGQSKRYAEKSVFAYGNRTGSPVFVYRLTNAFGKWSRPNYNSAVATFCYNITRDLPITVTDPSHMIRLVYIDDIVDEWLRVMHGQPSRDANGFCTAGPEHEISLGDLVTLLRSFRQTRQDLSIPSQIDPLTRKLFATYQSFLPPEELAYRPISHGDARGSFTELMHFGSRGQVSVNVSNPHIVKGEHWHQTKHEKFIVVGGHGVIRLRSVWDSTIYSYDVTGAPPTIIDIPPGYTHNIENLGDEPLVTIMWANEAFDPEHPDTYRLPVSRKE